MRDVIIGQTDYTVLVRITGTDGAPETGLVYTDIDLAYSRVETDNDVTTSDVTPATLASLTAAHSDWGFIEVSATDHPGLYRLDLADAVFASGAWESVVTITDASGSDFYAVDIGFRLVGIDKTAAAWAANVTQWLGTAPHTPYIAGIPLMHNAMGGRVWYVDYDTDGAGDTGTREAPFDTYGAAESAATAGDEIRFLPQTCTAAITVTKAGLTISGEGPASIIQISSGSALTVTNNTTVRNLYLDGDATGCYGLSANSCNNVLVEDCTILGDIDGLQITSSRAFRMRGCYVFGKWDAATFSSAVDFDVDNCYFTSDGTHGSGDDSRAIYAASAIGTLRNCRLYVLRTASTTAEAGGLDGDEFGQVILDHCTVTAYSSHASSSGDAFGIRGNATIIGGSVTSLEAGSGTSVDLDAGSGVIMTFGCNYDRSKTSGTVKDEYSLIDTEVAAIKTKTDFLPSATAGASGGLFIAGTNAATTVNITGNITGNLSGSVGSVTGAINTAAGTIQTLDALDTAQDTQHGTTQTATTAILADTNDLHSALILGSGVIGSTGNSTTVVHLDDLTHGASEIVGYGLVLMDASEGNELHFRTISSWSFVSKQATLSEALPFVPQDATDSYWLVPPDSTRLVIDAILADTAELQTDWANGGRLDLLLDTAAAGGGGGASSPQLLQSTTIATLASQTSFTLTAGSADNDAYNDMLAIFTDQSTSTQKAAVPIQDYVGSTKTVTLVTSPVFTIATGDTIAIVAEGSLHRISPNIVDTEDTWTFNSSSQTTSPKILTDTAGANPIYKAMDFTRPITGNASIASITSVTVADETGKTEPLITASAISPDQQKVHITLNAASASAGTYTFTVTIVTSSSSTVIRSGRLTLA